MSVGIICFELYIQIYTYLYVQESKLYMIYKYHDNNDHNKCFFYHVIIMIIMLQHFKYYLYLISLKHGWYVLLFSFSYFGIINRRL